MAEGNDGPTFNFMDRPALPVGPHSQDADAERGHAGGGFAKGHKLYAITNTDGAAELYRLRTTIERQFSQQSCYGGGVVPLPPWVRGLRRVTQWVGTKLMLYHVRLTAC